MRKKSFLLQDLINRNSRVFLSGNNQVRCGKCKRDTPQESSCSFNGELILIEIVRVIFKDEKQRNDSSVFFPLKGISLPGMPVITQAPLILDIGLHVFDFQMILGTRLMIKRTPCCNHICWGK